LARFPAKWSDHLGRLKGQNVKKLLVILLISATPAMSCPEWMVQNCRLYDEFNRPATQEQQLQFRFNEWQKVEDTRAQNVQQQRAIGRIQCLSYRSSKT
jgi:hypothetical protein